MNSWNRIEIVNSKKPLWIEDTKKKCKEIIPRIDLKELEETKDILMEDNNEDCEYDSNNYPFYFTIKKLIYAFGDCYKPNHKTVLYFHDFVKKWLISISKLVYECEIKKVLDHLYSYEYNKFINYRRLKLKNSFDEEVDKKVKEEEEFIDLEIDNEKSNMIENLVEDKDESYYENLAFQDERTKHMTDHEYVEYNNCRTQSFLSKGKKLFLNYVQTIIPNTPHEMKDQNNLEFISFLIKEIIHKIVKTAIKNKSNERKLIVLKYPISIDDIYELTNIEIDNIDSFMSDYYNSVYMMKEFKKKKFSKENNKNVKIKKKGNNFYVIIKKFIFIDDSESFKKLKKKSELNLLDLSKRITNIYFKTKKDKFIRLSKKCFLDDFPVSNYYEYYLLKDIIIIENDEIILYRNSIKKINKKYLNSKLNEWISINDKRRIIVNEYNRFIN